MISNNTACFHATNYHIRKNTGASKPCLNLTGFTGTWPELSGFVMKELEAGAYIADDECWLIKKLKVERRKILAVIDQPGSSQHHAIVVYGIRRYRNGDVEVYYRDQNQSSKLLSVSKLNNAFVKYLY